MRAEVKMLRAAADLLETAGHCKNIVKDDHGRYCLIGAINAVNKQNREFTYRHEDAVLTMLTHHVFSPGTPMYVDMCSIIDWNNAPERTAEEVIDAMRTVANLHDIESVEEKMSTLSAVGVK